MVCINNHNVDINVNSAAFKVEDGRLKIKCAVCNKNGIEVWVDSGPAPTDDVLKITTLGEDKFFTKEMCYNILKDKLYIKKTGVATDKTYMTLSALKTFVTDVFTGDAGVTTTCSKSTNDNYYPLESEISIVGKNYQTFTPSGDDVIVPQKKSVVLQSSTNDEPIYDKIIKEYHFYTKFTKDTLMKPTIYVVGTGTPPTTTQISVTVQYRDTTNETVINTIGVKNDNMSYYNVTDLKYVFNNEEYDWFGTVGTTSMDIIFVGLE